MKSVFPAIVLASALLPPPGMAAEPAAPRAAEAQSVQAIPFRKDDDIGGMALNVGLGLAVAIGAGVAALYLLRRYLAGIQKAPGRRLRVIETVRLGPRSALILVEVDGRSLLIGQQGDALSVLDNPPPAASDHAA